MRYLLPILYGLVSCGSANHSALSNQDLMADGRVGDFFVLESDDASFGDVGLVSSDCRSHIKKIVCLVEPIKGGGFPDGSPRTCLKGSQKYVEPFVKLHDAYPKALQKMFCSLDRIYVEKKFIGTAYAGLIRNKEGKITGAAMGIRQSVLDDKLDLTTWASWKEQLNFGGEKNSYKLTKGLPKHLTKSKTKANDFLYFVVAHEFGHFFDFTNDLNKIDPGCKGRECPFDNSSWGNLSWDSPASSRAEFRDRKNLCFYWCGSYKIPRQRIPRLFRDLHRSQFISTYAARHAWDDFADSMAYVVMDKYLKSKYSLNTSQSAVYNIMSKIHTKRFAKKKNYINFFLEGSKKYPKRSKNR